MFVTTDKGPKICLYINENDMGTKPKYADLSYHEIEWKFRVLGLGYDKYGEKPTEVFPFNLRADDGWADDYPAVAGFADMEVRVYTCRFSGKWSNDCDYYYGEMCLIKSRGLSERLAIYRKVEKRLSKLSENRGPAADCAESLARFCEVAGIRDIYIQTSSAGWSYSDGNYKIKTVSEMVSQIRHDIRNHQSNTDAQHPYINSNATAA